MKLICKVMMCAISLLLVGVAPVVADNATYKEITDYAVGAFEASNINMIGNVSVENSTIRFNLTILPDDQRNDYRGDSELHNRGELMTSVLHVAEQVMKKYPTDIYATRIFIYDPKGNYAAYASFVSPANLSSLS